jgi:hypothetical protein
VQLHHRGQLVLGQAVVAVAGLDQRGEEFVGRGAALVLDEFAGERQHRACRGRVGLERGDAAGEHRTDPAADVGACLGWDAEQTVIGSGCAKEPIRSAYPW